MINLEDCIELGFLTKPHGIKGQIVLKLNNLSFDDIKEMELVYIIIDGLPVPFFIKEFSERNEDSLLIKFEDVDSETEAKKYKELHVFLDRDIITHDESETFNPHHLSGYSVIDKNYGEVGILDTLIEYENNPVLRILKDRTEILIPFQEEFIIDIDNEARVIKVNCPEGLLDIYLG